MQLIYLGEARFYENIPYGQSSAKLPVTLSLSHLVTWSLDHLVTQSLNLIWSKGQHQDLQVSFADKYQQHTRTGCVLSACLSYKSYPIIDIAYCVVLSLLSHCLSMAIKIKHRHYIQKCGMQWCPTFLSPESTRWSECCHTQSDLSPMV